MVYEHPTAFRNACVRLLNAGFHRRLCDATFGCGGHAEAFLEAGAEVVGLDCDSSTLAQYGEVGKERQNKKLTLHHGSFSDPETWQALGAFDGICLDLGTSLYQLRTPERGLSFQLEGPLDMRLDGTQGPTLADILATISVSDLGHALRENADLKQSFKVARHIKEAWKKGRLKTTLDLARMVPMRPGSRLHPATHLFLGLRMLVNQELSVLTSGLAQCVTALKPGGRICVITFHSSEDRTAKRVLQRLAGMCQCPLQPCMRTHSKKIRPVFQRALRPTEDEVQHNPQMRSAQLRCYEKQDLNEAEPML